MRSGIPAPSNNHGSVRLHAARPAEQPAPVVTAQPSLDIARRASALAIRPSRLPRPVAPRSPGAAPSLSRQIERLTQRLPRLFHTDQSPQSSLPAAETGAGPAQGQQPPLGARIDELARRLQGLFRNRQGPRSPSAPGAADWSELPLDWVLEVMSHLDFPDLGRLSQTNRANFDASRQASVYFPALARTLARPAVGLPVPAPDDPNDNTLDRRVSTLLARIGDGLVRIGECPPELQMPNEQWPNPFPGEASTCFAVQYALTGMARALQPHILYAFEDDEQLDDVVTDIAFTIGKLAMAIDGQPAAQRMRPLAELIIAAMSVDATPQHQFAARNIRDGVLRSVDRTAASLPEAAAWLRGFAQLVVDDVGQAERALDAWGVPGDDADAAPSAAELRVFDLPTALLRGVGLQAVRAMSRVARRAEPAAIGSFLADDPSRLHRFLRLAQSEADDAPVSTLASEVATCMLDVMAHASDDRACGTMTLIAGTPFIMGAADGPAILGRAVDLAIERPPTSGEGWADVLEQLLRLVSHDPARQVAPGQLARAFLKFAEALPDDLAPDAFASLALASPNHPTIATRLLNGCPFAVYPALRARWDAFLARASQVEGLARSRGTLL